MRTNLLGPAISHGEASGVTAGTQLVYLGADLLIAWEVDTATWHRFERPSGPGSRFDLRTPVASGRTVTRRGWRVSWAGGDSALFYQPSTGVISLQPIARASRADPFAAAPFHGESIGPGLELTYLGRTYFAHRDANGVGGAVFRLHEGRFVVPSSAAWGSFPPPEPLWFKGGPLYWIGGDRMLRISTSTDAIDAFAYAGARVASAVAPVFPRPPSSVIDFAEADIVYVGGNEALVWRSSVRRWTLHPVQVATSIEPAIEDYLEQHTDVRSALGWSIPEGPMVPYARWHEHQETAGHYGMLGKPYRALAGGGLPTLAYESEIDPVTTEPRVGPELIVDYWFTPGGAAEVFLAHAAQSLWMEVAEQVPWRLHTLEPSDQRALLRSDRMFMPGTTPGTTDHLTTNIYAIGSVTPTNPSIPLRFVLGDDVTPTDRIRNGPSLQAATMRETALAVTRWLRDNAWHSRNIHYPHGALQAYGYPFHPPYDRVFRKVDDPQGHRTGPQHWAWNGCHGAAALVVSALRALNIPARAVASSLETGAPALQHRTIELPGESLFVEHADWIYAEAFALDPSVDPEDVYSSITDYASRRASVTSVPDPGEDRTTLVNRMKARVGLDARSYHFVHAWWEGELYGTTLFESELAKFGYTAAEAAQMRQVDGPRLQEIVDDFLASNGLVDGVAALTAYAQAYQAWHDARGS